MNREKDLIKTYWERFYCCCFRKVTKQKENLQLNLLFMAFESRKYKQYKFEKKKSHIISDLDTNGVFIKAYQFILIKDNSFIRKIKDEILEIYNEINKRKYEIEVMEILDKSRKEIEETENIMKILID